MRQRYCDSMQFSANSHSGHRSLVLPFLTPAGRALSIGPGQREVARRHAKYRCRIAGVEIDHRAPDIGCGAAIIHEKGVIAGAADQDSPALTIRRKGTARPNIFPPNRLSPGRLSPGQDRPGHTGQPVRDPTNTRYITPFGYSVLYHNYNDYLSIIVSISASEYPASARISRECSPSFGHGRCTFGGDWENRAAIAGMTTSPSIGW